MMNKRHTSHTSAEGHAAADDRAPAGSRTPTGPTGGRADTPRGTSLNARLFPPATPVDVPRLPPKATQARDASAANGAPANPVIETDAEHSWADNTRPAPYKKKARTSIF